MLTWQCNQHADLAMQPACWSTPTSIHQLGSCIALALAVHCADSWQHQQQMLALLTQLVLNHMARYNIHLHLAVHLLTFGLNSSSQRACSPRPHAATSSSRVATQGPCTPQRARLCSSSETSRGLKVLSICSALWPSSAATSGVSCEAEQLASLQGAAECPPFRMV